ncbi:MAG TPA: choice-of-anchor D domain-containing protein [Terriglobia bacterium]|nr:choice-of-anchor D domain-containing protein [Terriglobia bacterium]
MKRKKPLWGRATFVLLFLVASSSPAFAQTASLSTTSLNFNNQVVGTASAAKTVKVTNSGAATLTISSILASGDFAIQAASTTCGTTVNPTKSCKVGVTFTPTSTGTRNGALAFTDNASDSRRRYP